MKRQFYEADAIIPARVFSERPGLKSTLDEMQQVVSEADALRLKKTRLGVALNTDPIIKEKILRVFIRHSFYAATASEKAYFMVRIEGALLDSNAGKPWSLGQFFDRVSIQLDKKYQSQNCEWKEDEYPAGVQAQSFATKIFIDKPCAIKVSLQRSFEHRIRYNISDQLRRVLPNIQLDATEDEILLAMWQYIEVRGLFSTDKDKRSFRLDEVQLIAY
jgi:hypothetical protein